MSIEVRIPTILRNYTGGERAVQAEGSNVGDLITDLEKSHEGIRERLMDNDQIRRFINVYVNDEDIRFAGGLDAELIDGDTVVILPAVAGGAG